MNSLTNWITSMGQARVVIATLIFVGLLLAAFAWLN
jgi:hypothetical protein